MCANVARPRARCSRLRLTSALALLVLDLACERKSPEEKVFHARFSRMVEAPLSTSANWWLLRTTPSSDGALLLQPVSPAQMGHEQRIDLTLAGRAWSDNVFKFDPVSAKVEKVSAAVWESAKSPITGCPSEAFGDQSSNPRVNPTGEKLIYNNGVVRTQGKTVLSIRVSPHGDKVAVLSAEGERERRESIVPFMGGRGSAPGARTHELFRLPEMTQVGKPVTLPIAGEPEPIWSADEKHVVYVDGDDVFFLTVPQN